MNQTERLYRIEQLLRSRACVPLATFLQELEVSRATVIRDIERLRDRHNAPIVYDPARHGYRLDPAAAGTPRQELPGLWFSGREAHALLAFHHFLESLEPGLLAAHIAPLRQRIEALLEHGDRSLAEVTGRIRILPQAARPADPAAFSQVADALLARRRLAFRYHGRGRDDTTDRRVSPQRLLHYRDNWYLDAWDHGRRALRTFAVERIRSARTLPEPARDLAEDRLNRHFAESYGIFAGRPKHRALLRFTPERARWVADEHWHPRQKGWYEGKHYCLEIPYSDDRELVLDILKHGPEVEVLRPKSLRQKVLDQLLRAASQYRR